VISAEGIRRDSGTEPEGRREGRDGTHATAYGGLRVDASALWLLFESAAKVHTLGPDVCDSPPLHSRYLEAPQPTLVMALLPFPDAVPPGALASPAALSGGRSQPLRAVQRLTGHLVVALVALVAIGGATRVLEAGLACPDWPLCYGVLLPGRQMNLQVFLEWFHRLDAFLVGVALLVLAGFSLRNRVLLPRWLPWATGGALLLVALQGGLGALTVLQLLEASTVTAHLGTGLALVLLLSAMHQALLAPAQSGPDALPRHWWPLALPAGLLLFGQCLLGGAMATRWAADLCLSAGEGCRWLLWHRLGAWPAAVGLVLLALASLPLAPAWQHLRRLSFAALMLVALQVLLGLLCLRLQLAVPAVSVAHQLGAALLVALLGAIWGRALAASRSFAAPLP
jgi:cytochrome c oxidase assembly protein subunit 15